MASKRIYIGNLSYSLTEEEVSALFAKHGNVQSCEIMRERETGRSRGFAFLEFDTIEEARSARKEDGTELNGRNIKVNVAKERTNQTRNEPRMRRGFNQGGNSYGQQSFGGGYGGNQGGYGGSYDNQGGHGGYGGHSSYGGQQHSNYGGQQQPTYGSGYSQGPGNFGGNNGGYENFGQNSGGPSFGNQQQPYEPKEQKQQTFQAPYKYY